MNRVRIYTIENCSFCTDLKNSLDSLGIIYYDVDVNLPEHEEEFNSIMDKTKTDDVPVVVVDKHILAPNVSFQSIEELVKLIIDLLNR